MQEWFSEEWDTVNAAYENTGVSVFTCYYTRLLIVTQRMWDFATKLES